MGSGRTQAQLVISQTNVQPTGDPQVILDFQLELMPSTSLSNGDKIELLNLPDIDSRLNPTYRYSLDDMVYDTYMTVATSTNGDGTTDITLTYDQSPTSAFTNSSDTNSLPIGDLFALTTANYPPPPDSPILDPISYTSQVGADTYNGTTTPSVIPEPAGVVLVGLGLSSAWLIRRRLMGRKRGVSPLAF
jgi:hypothetical protein